MSTLQKILSQAKTRPATIALSEGTDARIVEAAVHAAREGIAKIILVGPHGEVSDKLGQAGGEAKDDLTIVDPETSALRHDLIRALVEARAHKGMTAQRATDAISDPLVFAAMLVRTGHADGTLGGAINPTADVVRHAIQLIGVAPDAKIVSSFFLMELSETGKSVIFADCALVVDPSADELSNIATASADNFAKFVGETPSVGLLSFSTKGSAHHPNVSKIREAAELARSTRPDLAIDGELQFDAAFDPSVAVSKAPESTVAGKANVFVFPNLDAANIGYKIAQRIGGATAVGPILQGLAKPANDLSRGCSADDVYHLIAATAVQSNR